jgi:hypothetical protein
VVSWVTAAGLLTVLGAQPDTTRTASQPMMSDTASAMCPMMHGKMGLQVIPTSDGGIIVVSGNRLSKYDKDLNLKKETTVAMDSLSMRNMQRMKSCCPMMRQGKP